MDRFNEENQWRICALQLPFCIHLVSPFRLVEDWDGESVEETYLYQSRPFLELMSIKYVGQSGRSLMSTWHERRNKFHTTTSFTFKA